ncbi:MAG TPA: flavodoxin domain-containing protein [Silvibacterium sp.]|nr:flavodoxin domain-containing protein [Silvibacterium sp.]
MRVLVVHASRYGSTKGIAEPIGENLRQRGFETTVRPAQNAGDPAAYDGVVLGSAAYYFHWMKEASAFVKRYRATLEKQPVWLFSSGPLGTKTIDAQGSDVCSTLEPKEIAGFRPAIHPRDHRVFFGALIPTKLGLLHRLMFHLPANGDRQLFPEGDFRNWNDIDAWAVKIADELSDGGNNDAESPHEPAVSA